MKNKYFLKRNFLLLTLILISSFSFAQGNIKSYLRAITLNSNVYNTKVDLTLNQFSKTDGTLLTTKKDVVLKPANGKTIRYKIIGTDGDYTIIKLLPNLKINSDNSVTVDIPANETENASKYLYSIKTKEFGLYQKNILSEKIVGTPLVFPYKLRLQDRGDGATITTDFTVGYTFGLRLKTGKLPFKQNFFTIIPYGFGLGSTKYFFENTDGTFSEKKDAVAITYYTGGIMWTVNKINFGLFAGRDAMIDKQNNWAHQGDWWFSFGLGFKFKTD